MDSPYALTLVAAVAILAIPVIRYLVTPTHPANSKFPPGPEPYFLVGNIPQIPSYHSWLKFKEWSDRFGPLFRFSVCGTYHYVVSTEKIANALLRDRGANYSSREQFPAAAVLLSGGQASIFAPVEPGNPKTVVWKNGRKFFHNTIGPNAVQKYYPYQELESLRLLSALIQDPSKYELWFNRFAAGVVFRLGYGKAVHTGEESYVKEGTRMLRVVEHTAKAGSYLVDVFPSLMILPAWSWLAPWKRYLLEQQSIMRKHFSKQLAEVKQDMVFGRAPQSCAKTYLESPEETGLNETEAEWLLGVLYSAGAGTTSASLLSHTLAMVLHPQWQKRVQDEMDRIVGAERLPNFDDLPNLPAVRAAIKETMRWRPMSAGGIPHKSVKDDVYAGWFVPAGTNIHPNLWAIHREPELYPDPETYNPDRWLLPEFPTYKEPLTKFPNLQNFSVFGFGRRICPGQYLAEKSVTLVAARLAWAVTMSKKKGSDGKDIEVSDWDYTTEGFNTQPKPFPFDVKVRDEKRLKVLEDALEVATKNDPLRGR